MPDHLPRLGWIPSTWPNVRVTSVRPDCRTWANERYEGTVIGMVKEKVTLTLDADNLAALRSLVGRGSLSATVDAALGERVALLRHQAAVDDWLTELDTAHGPVPPETLEWAARLVDQWDAERVHRKAG